MSRRDFAAAFATAWRPLINAARRDGLVMRSGSVDWVRSDAARAGSADSYAAGYLDAVADCSRIINQTVCAVPDGKRPVHSAILELGIGMGETLRQLFGKRAQRIALDRDT